MALSMIFMSVLGRCGGAGSGNRAEEPGATAAGEGSGHLEATFAGGCFWCMEAAFEELEGVEEAVSGYTGGSKKNPTYEEVCSGSTGHLEAVRVAYDPSVISYDELLDVFWKQIDPTDAGGQFADRGSQYRTAIFHHDEDQRLRAEKSKKDLERSGKFDGHIVTQIRPAVEFYEAEQYHQDYFRKNPTLYQEYKTGSGRASCIDEIWKNDKGPPSGNESYEVPDREKLRSILTPMQYHVTQEGGTEPPFDNEYWNSKEKGIYVDVVSGEPLFGSPDKFDSGTGWPSFTGPLEPGNIVEKKDTSHGMTRTEVGSAHAGSHLGHVFGDGPPPTGLRYCINSAALRFIPLEDLEDEGYGRYLELFEK